MPNLANLLPPWSGDCAEQSLFIDALKQSLQNALTAAEAFQVNPIFLSQSTPPTQAQWETAYVAQTGRALPIMPAAQLLWWNSAANVFGGMYGTTPLSTTVFSRTPAQLRGTMIFQQSKQPAGTNIGALGVNSFSETISFTTTETFNLELIHSVHLSVTSVGVPIGGDFLMNGIKVGTAYYGVQNNRSLSESQVSQQFITRFFLENLPPGAYVFQNIFGWGGTGSPGVASRLGVAQFTVRAFSA